MTLGDTRTILERLAAGEMTAEEAEEALAATESAPPAPAPEGPAAERVSASLNGGSLIEMQGDAVSIPRVEGPARCTITEADGGYRITGQVGDDAVVIVPADADLHLRLSCADVEISGVTGAIEATINAGDIDLDWDLSRGESRLVVNAGDLRLRFGPRSDVAVTVRAPTSVVADEGFHKAGRGYWVLGDGRAHLEIDGNLGTIYLETE